MIESVTFNGVTISDRWRIVNVERDPSQMTLKTQTVQGRPGAVLTGAAPGTFNVRFTVLVDGKYSTDRREQLLQLRAVLQTDEPKRLEFSDEGKRYRLAMLASIKETLYKRRTAWLVTMTVLQPYLFADDERAQAWTRSVSGVAGWGVELDLPEIGGTASSWPRVQIADAKPGSNGYVEVELDGTYKMRVPLSVSTGVEVTINTDPADRWVRVGTVYTMLTTDSDFWQLAPGAHVVELSDGNGTQLGVYWRERWGV